MSGPDIDQAVDALHATRRDLRAAAGTIEELRDAVRAVRRTLDEATLDAAKTRLVEEPTASGYMRHVAGQLGQLAARCARTGPIGQDLGTHLHHAAQHVQQAKEALDEVDPADASIDELQVAARARTRLDGLGDLLEMAGPVADSATGHLAAAGHIAAQHAQADPSRASRVDVDQGIGVATDVLARTETHLRHLDDLLDRSDRGTRRLLGEADEVTQHAHHRMTMHRRRPPAAAPPTTQRPRR